MAPIARSRPMTYSNTIHTVVGTANVRISVIVSSDAIDSLPHAANDVQAAIVELHHPLITTIVLDKVARGCDRGGDVHVSLADVSSFPMRALR